MNIIDDKEMSSQGSVNAPVAPPQSPTQGQATPQLPSPVFVIPSSVVSTAPTQQSGVAGTSGASRTTIPVESTEVVAARTIVVDAPTRDKTKQAFDKVSSALCSASLQQEAMRVEMEQLSRGMEQMRME